MKVEQGKVYKVLSDRYGYLAGNVFTVDCIGEIEIDITFDNRSPFFEDVKVMDALQLEELKMRKAPTN